MKLFKNCKFKVQRIRELPYHYDIVTPYIRFKYMTDVLYNRMIEVGFWWWRWEFHFHGSQKHFISGNIMQCAILIPKLIFYVIIDTTKYYFKKLFKIKSNN